MSELGRVAVKVWSAVAALILAATLIQDAYAASYYPSGYNLLGGTTLVSGTLSNLQADDGSYMVFRSAGSATSNRIQNPSFESSGSWVTTVNQGGQAMVQDGTVAYSGTYSGRTSTTNPTGSNSYARLTQTFPSLLPVSSIPNQAGSLTLYLRHMASAKNGNNTAWVAVASSQGRTLCYIWRLDGSAIPSDTSTIRYIDMGTTLPSGWVQVSRNFYEDWVVTKGWPSTDTISSIELQSNGLKDGKKLYGQRINWDDITLLYYTEYTAEVEFTGTSDTNSWHRLIWTVDSSWTAASVSVTLQLYNYQTNSYPTSGDGYISYTSSATPNTDETKTQTITTNPTNFKDSSGSWKLKIKGVKSATSPFDLRVDLVRYEPSATYTRTASDTAALTDTSSRLSTLTRTQTETFSITDAVSKIYTQVRQVAESLNIAPQVERAATLTRSITQGITITPAVSRAINVARHLYQTIQASDSVSRMVHFLRQITETQTITDTVQRAVKLWRTLTETPAITDSIQRVAYLTRAVTETSAVSDALTRQYQGYRTLNEAQTIADNVARSFVGIRTLTETPTVSDQLSRLIYVFRSMSDGAAVSETLQRIQYLFRNIGEASTYLDEISRSLTAARTATLTVSISDEVARAANIARIVSDATGISDAAQ
ncbi:MAG: hypothetical protein QXL21_07955, partial [Nitrososphaerales archaeon]